MREAKMLAKKPILESRAYKLKAWICIALGLTPEHKVGVQEVLVAVGPRQRRVVETPPDWEVEKVAVTETRVLTVGRGLLSNWWYDVYWWENHVKPMKGQAV